MGFFTFFKKENSGGAGKVVNIVNASGRYTEVIVRNNLILYESSIIGSYIYDGDYIIVTAGKCDIEFKFDEFVTFINKTRNHNYACSSNKTPSFMPTGPIVEVNDNYIVSVPENNLLAKHNGDPIKGLVAFVSYYASIERGGKYHDYFVI